MKKILLLLISVSFMISCTENITVKKQSIIGYDISDEGEKRTLVAGPMSNVEVWEKYIKAHNERDFETIMNMNSDDFKARGPKGEYIVAPSLEKRFFLLPNDNLFFLNLFRNGIDLDFVLVLTLFSSFRNFMTFHMSK